MPNRRVTIMDLRMLLLHLRDTPSDRAVARDIGLHRQTVSRYRHWATTHDLLTDPLPSLEQIQTTLATTLPATPPPQNVSSVAPYRDQVLTLRAQGVEVAALYQRLTEQGYTGSYAAVYRFVRSLEPPVPDATVRVERAPGEEAQVDFGAVGRLQDPATGAWRKAWAFVMTLAWSRYAFVTFVFDQTVPTWLRCHQLAFAFFGGVPARVVIDNLKAGITHACWDDPQVQASYRECAEHYGFRIAPCRPATPEHKGKVESGVHYVQRNFFGGRAPSSLSAANADVLVWCRMTAGERCHGTTHEAPRARFEQVEAARLRPLPAAPYEYGVWKLAVVHRDCYVTFDNAYYSVPFRLVGQQVRVRGGAGEVRLYTPAYELVATHVRATQPGVRQTHLDHLPPYKLPGLTLTREAAQAQAAAIGPATAAVVAALLADPVLERLPVAGRLVRLAERYDVVRLEAACGRALDFGDPSYRTVAQILAAGLETAPLPTPPPAPPPTATFRRSAGELLEHLFGGRLWN
jgi:transposase